MEKKGTSIKYKKLSTMTGFDRRKLNKEKEKHDIQMKDSRKLFGKLKELKTMPLRNIISPLLKENRILAKKSKNLSLLFFPKRPLRFNLSKPVYSYNKKNLLTIKSSNYNTVFFKLYIFKDKYYILILA